jgi:hypothetical protein
MTRARFRSRSTFSGPELEIMNIDSRKCVDGRLGAQMREFRTPQFARGQELEQSLWHCRRCAALIAIYSAAAIESAMCPICCDVTLDARGNFETILGMATRKRSPAAS